MPRDKTRQNTGITVNMEDIVGKFFKWSPFNSETDRYYYVVKHVDCIDPYCIVLTLEDTIYLTTGFEVRITKERLADSVVEHFREVNTRTCIKEITKEEFYVKFAELIEKAKNWEEYD